MAALTKNEIVELKSEIKVGNETYPVGTRFVVTKVTKEKIHLSQLKQDHTLNGSFSGKIASILNVFVSTNTKYIEPKAASVQVKKGNFYTFKKEFNESGSKFPVGTRVVIIKGGKCPQFITQAMDGRVFTVNTHFITEFFDAAEAAQCELTADWQVKGLQERQGEETRNFIFNLYYKGKKMGDASNDGQGGCHRVHVYGDEWKVLNKAALEICKAVDTSKSDQFAIREHDVEEYLVDFFLDNYNGLSTLKDYLERRVKDWCDTVSRHLSK